MSKAEIRRRKRQRNAMGATEPAARTSAPNNKQTARPTPERWARGNWAEATGAGRDARPLVDLSSDLIGRLYEGGELSSSQHEAARRFQEVRDAFVAELGAVGYRSCLAGGSGGHDSGDGNPEIIRQYRAVSDRLGRAHMRTLVDNVHKLSDERVTDLGRLKAALDLLRK